MSAVRITIMGVGGVGKSALTQRVVNKKFVAKVSARASSRIAAPDFNGRRARAIEGALARPGRATLTQSLCM